MIKGLDLDIDGVKVSIPIEKAKELYKDLDALFGNSPSITYPPHTRDWFNLGEHGGIHNRTNKSIL